MKEMKNRWIYKGIVAAALCAVSFPVLHGGTLSAGDTLTRLGVRIGDPVLKRNGDLMSVRFRVGLEELPLPGDRAALFSPVLVNGADSVDLPPVGVYGRTRWYQYLRSEEPLGGAEEKSFRYSERPADMAYSVDVPYGAWMNGGKLVLWRRDYGCCRTLLDSDRICLAGYRERVPFVPVFRYAKPVASVKTYSLSGRAYIDFPVNRTEIHADYRKNPAELKKITGTIDSIRGDKDITVSSITIKGYASPEGSYANNARLAKGRTETLKKYVADKSRFDEGLIKTAYEPEDWAGLRNYVENSDLEHREAILALIDGDLGSDAKNSKIQAVYPKEYRFLLQTVYPGLRHSDYTIEYTVRGYSDVNEIAALLRTTPQKLSLGEMYLLAQTLEPGSGEFDEVMKTAVQMFPGDETANLNAANAAMSRKDLKDAERYLMRAGGGAEAEYARGMLKALQGDHAGAKEKVLRAQSLGMSGVEEMLSHLEEVEASMTGQSEQDN